MPDLLPGYTWVQRIGRYRDQATGRFVARDTILGLLNSQAQATEQRLHNLTTALMEGRIAPSAYVGMMHVELKNLHLQMKALGAGGWDRLTARDYGAVGGRLSASLRRVRELAADVQAGSVTTPQALNRVRGYVGEARIQFWGTERAAQQRTSTGMIVIERRLLGPADQHCPDCVDYYERGWRLVGELPLPGMDSVCQSYCKCSIIRREVPASEVRQWIGSRRSS